MTLWQFFLLCVSLSCVQSVPSEVLHHKYMRSYNITRTTRCRVQHLLVKYKREQLGSSEYKDRSQHLPGLPSPSTDFFNWLKLTDRQRLDTALSDIQTFRNMLEWKREQLKSTTNTNSTIPQKFHHIECDLRDLLKEVTSQMKAIGGSPSRPHSTTSLRENAISSRSQWDSRVKGYIILRDLDLYLIKLSRDFLLLATKTSRTQRQTGQSTLSPQVEHNNVFYS